jgi:integrase
MLNAGLRDFAAAWEDVARPELWPNRGRRSCGPAGSTLASASRRFLDFAGLRWIWQPPASTSGRLAPSEPISGNRGFRSPEASRASSACAAARGRSRLRREYRRRARIKDIKRGFTGAARRAGLIEMTPHTLRHTCATWLLQRGVTIWNAARFLHMSPETLQTVYGHHCADHMSAAVRAFIVNRIRGPIRGQIS